MDGLDVLITAGGGGALVLALLTLGAVQAIIGVLQKFGLTGVKLLTASLAVVWVLVGASYYLAAYEVYRWLLVATMVTLASAGYWRFRNGAPTVMPPDSEELEEV